MVEKTESVAASPSSPSDEKPGGLITQKSLLDITSGSSGDKDEKVPACAQTLTHRISLISIVCVSLSEQ